MRVSRTSGLPVQPTDLLKYHEDLKTGLDEIKALSSEPIDKLPVDEQAEFIRKFEEMREVALAKYKCEEEWDFETVLRSKSKLKEMVNIYGIIAFARGSEDKQLQCFIIDSDVNIGGKNG